MNSIGSRADYFNFSLVTEKLSGNALEINFAGEPPRRGLFSPKGQRDLGRPDQSHLALLTRNDIDFEVSGPPACEPQRCLLHFWLMQKCRAPVLLKVHVGSYEAVETVDNKRARKSGGLLLSQICGCYSNN